MKEAIKIYMVPGFIISCLSLQSCSRTFDREEYVSWIRDYDNGVHVKKTVGEYVFDVQYQPASYIELQRLGVAGHCGVDVNRRSSDELQYYLLVVSLDDRNVDFIDHNVGSMEEKQRKIYYFSYRFQYDIFLEEGGEELPCLMYHFERPIDPRGSRTILLGFSKSIKSSSEATMRIISDQFGALPVRIKISKANIPELNL